MKNNTEYTENSHCLVCERPIDFIYLDLGNQPLANSYHRGEQLKRYPLQLLLCTHCWHSQLSVLVNPKEMFEHYLYVSDTSKTLTDYFRWVTGYIIGQADQPKTVLEIACNSGLLLEMFQNEGLVCHGVDPAKNLRELSEQKNLNVFVDYWNTKFSNYLKGECGKFDLVLAFHVLPHVENPNDFISACKNILSSNGKIFVQTSQCDMFLNGEFDVIYHEHSSYFTANSIKELAHRNELYISSIIKTNIHGKSFLFSLQTEPCDEFQLNELIELERSAGIYTREKYLEFAANAVILKNKLLFELNKFRNNNYVMIGYGAAAKGNTLLNFIDFKLDYIIDDNPMKWGYLTPGANIPIHSIELLKTLPQKICFVPLAWNFYDEIVERIKKIRYIKDDIFIKYYPQFLIETL